MSVEKITHIGITHDKLWYLLTRIEEFQYCILYYPSSMHQMSKHVSIHDKQVETRGNKNLGLILHSPFLLFASEYLENL